MICSQTFSAVTFAEQNYSNVCFLYSDNLENTERCHSLKEKRENSRIYSAWISAAANAAGKELHSVHVCSYLLQT